MENIHKDYSFEVEQYTGHTEDYFARSELMASKISGVFNSEPVEGMVKTTYLWNFNDSTVMYQSRRNYSTGSPALDITNSARLTILGTDEEKIKSIDNLLEENFPEITKTLKK